MTDLLPILEALLFCADAPLAVAQIVEVLPEATAEEVARGLAELQARYEDGNHGVGLFRVAGGYQFLTRPTVAEWVEKFLVGRRRQRLSRAALETLAIVAYRQPITRGEIEAIRGVDCGGVLHTLLERRLVAVRGRAKRIGSPLLYATTERFMEHFGVTDLAELPKLEEFRALCDRDEAQAELRRQGVLPLSAGDAEGDPKNGDATPEAESSAEAAPAPAARPGRRCGGVEESLPATADASLVAHGRSDAEA